MSVKPRLFGKRYDWEYGVNTPRPSDSSSSSSSKKGSWLGNKLREAGHNLTANLDANKAQYNQYLPTHGRKKRMDQEQQDRLEEDQYTIRKAEERQRGYQEGIDNEYGYTPQSPIYRMEPTMLQQGTPGVINRADAVGINPYTPVTDVNQAAAWGARPEDFAGWQEMMNQKALAGQQPSNEPSTDEQFPGNNPSGMKYGGSYQVGGQYDMTQEEIQKLIDGGYEFDYLD
jgi:hypothetical protein